MPNARNESKTGSANPRIFVESRVARHTTQATPRATAVAIIRLPVETSSRLWQCGHSIASESAMTRVAGTVPPHCGQIRTATYSPRKKQTKKHTKISQWAANEKRGITWPRRIPRGGGSDRYDRRERVHDHQVSRCARVRHARRRWHDRVRCTGSALLSLLPGGLWAPALPQKFPSVPRKNRTSARR